MVSDPQHEKQQSQYVSFVLHREEYGVPILNVQEIIRYETLTRVPRSPDYVDGVLNLRGQVIPVVNLRKKFELPEKEIDKSTRIIVVEVKDRVIGMVVDEVSEVLPVDSADIAPPPPMGTHLKIDFISGMAKINNQLVILLDIHKVLTTEERMVVEQLADAAVD